MTIYSRVLIVTLFLLINISVFAHNGPGGRGFQGNSPHPGGDYNHHGYNNGYRNGYNNGYYYGGGDSSVIVNNGDDDIWYDDGSNDDDSTNVAIGVPDSGYYDPSCQTVTTCNSSGTCITQQNCNNNE